MLLLVHQPPKIIHVPCSQAYAPLVEGICLGIRDQALSQGKIEPLDSALMVLEVRSLDSGYGDGRAASRCHRSLIVCSELLPRSVVPTHARIDVLYPKP